MRVSDCFERGKFDKFYRSPFSKFQNCIQKILCESVPGCCHSSITYDAVETVVQSLDNENIILNLKLYI